MRALPFSLMVVVSLLLAPDGFAQETTVRKSLQAAITAGEVQVEFTSNGASSGDSIVLTVGKTQRAVQQILILTLPTGLRLANSSKATQSMVLASVRGRLVGENSLSPESNIAVNSSDPTKYVLAAYCADFNKANPSSDSKFTLEAADPKISCVLKNAAKRNLSVHATQAAVWIETDGVDLETINHKFEIKSDEWSLATQAVADCKSRSIAKAKATDAARPSPAVSSKADQSQGAARTPVTPPTQAKNGPMTNADVVTMIREGLSEKTIELMFQSTPVAFDTSPTAIIALHKQRVPNGVLDAMVRRQAEQNKSPSFGNQGSPAPGVGLVGGLTGIQVSELSEQIRRGAPNARGVYISKIDDSAPAKASGLSAGDVIQSVVLAGSPNSALQNSADFYRLAARCVPDCLVGFYRAALNYSSLHYVAIGEVGTTFVAEYDPLGKVRAYRNAKVTSFPLGSPYPADPTLPAPKTRVMTFQNAMPATAADPRATGFGFTASPGYSYSPYPARPTPQLTRPLVNAPLVQITPEEVDNAIAKGTQERGLQGIKLSDVGSEAMQLLALGLIAAGSTKNQNKSIQVPASGFEVWLLTPRDWIAQNASLAVANGRTFTRRDVTPEMLHAVLHILAFPSTPPPTGQSFGTSQTSGIGQRFGTSQTSGIGQRFGTGQTSGIGQSVGLDVSPVLDVFLTDLSRQQRLEPIAKEPFQYQGLLGQAAQFLLSDVSRIRQEHADFFVAVKGSGGNHHEFQVKAKHGFEMQ